MRVIDDDLLVPTRPPGDSSHAIANTAFVRRAVGGLQPPVIWQAPPTSPCPGQLWWSTEDGQLYVWTGTAWVAASCCEGGNGVAVGSSPPTGAGLWWSTVDGNLYIWTGSEWAAASCCAGGSGGGAATGYINVKNAPYNAIGNGTTVDLPAITSAMTAAANAGGGIVYFPPGTYYLGVVSGSNTIQVPNNTMLVGAGPEATIFTADNTSNGIVISVPNISGYHYTNPLYPINAPAYGANTVTTTTPADAANFTVGGYIIIAGPTFGTAANLPFWFTTVTAINTTTGVITLNETLPFGPNGGMTGVMTMTGLSANITIRDLTVVVPAATGYGAFGIGIFVAQNVLVDNVHFRPPTAVQGQNGTACTIGNTRNGIVRNCLFLNSSMLELFSSSDCILQGNILLGGNITLDGGPFNCTVIGNHVKDPHSSTGGLQHAIWSDQYTRHNSVIGNTILGVPAGMDGILFEAPNSGGFNTCIGNRILGAGDPSSAGTVGIGGAATVCTGNYLENLTNPIGLASNNAAETFYVSGNVAIGCQNILGTSGIPVTYRFQEPPGMQNLSNPSGTVTVTAGSFYQATNASPATITALSGPDIPYGDDVTFAFTDGNTSFGSGGGINLLAHATMQQYATITFVCNAVLSGNTRGWVEKCRNNPISVGLTSVTQLTSKSTAVTSNTLTGVITMNNAALAAGATVTFKVNCSAVLYVSDVVIANIAGGIATNGTYNLIVDSIIGGAFYVSLTNHSAGSLSEAVVINYVVLSAIPF